MSVDFGGFPKPTLVTAARAVETATLDAQLKTIGPTVLIT